MIKSKVLLTMFVSILIVGCGKEIPSGADGKQGVQGPPGTPSTPPYAVQLCPNEPPPSYPSSFPEVALCIDGTLYGVYNGNVDYFAALPPGDYISLAPEGCNLIIEANCVVKQQ